jgi:hypothetical protein
MSAGAPSDRRGGKLRVKSRRTSRHGHVTVSRERRSSAWLAMSDKCHGRRYNVIDSYSRSTVRRQDEMYSRRQTAALKRECGSLFTSISEALFKADPAHINSEVNTDEYEPEVAAIIPRLSFAQSAEDVQIILYDELVRSLPTIEVSKNALSPSRSKFGRSGAGSIHVRQKRPNRVTSRITDQSRTSALRDSEH